MARKQARYLLRRGLQENVESALALKDELVITSDTRRLYVGDEHAAYQPIAGLIDASVGGKTLVEDAVAILDNLTVIMTLDMLENFEDPVGSGLYPDLIGLNIIVTDDFSRQLN